MTVDRFDGDPKITIDEDGSDIPFSGGQPVMDAGLENSMVISLHTRKGWCGNVLFDDPDEQIGSDYEKEANKTKTLSQLNVTRSAAEKAIQWFLDKGISSENRAHVANPVGNTTQTTVLTRPINQDPLILQETSYGENWIQQIINPAHKRV